MARLGLKFREIRNPIGLKTKIGNSIARTNVLAIEFSGTKP